MLGDVLDRAVKVVEVTPADVAQTMRDKGACTWDAEHLGEMLTLFRECRSEYVTDHVLRLTGRAPTSPLEFLLRHRGLTASS